MNKFTVLIGPNNSGKSTFFKGLNLVRSIPFAGGGITCNSNTICRRLHKAAKTIV
ncbi:MAG: ATP-binding protein [Nitrosopumilus sp.]|nr:ATP-binding protein [Nitrosopumilus sp.]